MSCKLLLPAILTAFICVAASPVLNGQTPDEKWNRVTSLSSDTRLFVENDGRKPIKGRLVSATDQTLTIKADGREIAIPRAGISAIYFGKRPSRTKRGLIGALAGAGAGVLIGGIAAVAGADPLVAAGGFLYGIPAGAVIGVATAGGMKKGNLIYSR